MRIPGASTYASRCGTVICSTWRVICITRVEKSAIVAWARLCITGPARHGEGRGLRPHSAVTIFLRLSRGAKAWRASSSWLALARSGCFFAIARAKATWAKELPVGRQSLRAYATAQQKAG